MDKIPKNESTKIFILGVSQNVPSSIHGVLLTGPSGPIIPYGEYSFVWALLKMIWLKRLLSCPLDLSTHISILYQSLLGQMPWPCWPYTCNASCADHSNAWKVNWYCYCNNIYIKGSTVMTVFIILSMANYTQTLSS